MTRRRATPEVRRQEILDAAIPLAVRHGYDRITREQIAEAAGCSGPTVQYHYQTMDQLRRCLMRMAVRTECLEVIAQGIVRNDKQAKKAPPELQRKAMRNFR